MTEYNKPPLVSIQSINTIGGKSYSFRKITVGDMAGINIEDKANLYANMALLASRLSAEPVETFTAMTIEEFTPVIEAITRAFNPVAVKAGKP